MTESERTLHLARGWLRIGDSEKAAACCRRALEANPEMPDVWWFLLDLLVRLERAWQALDCCEALLRIDPTHRRLQQLAGVCQKSWEEHHLPDQNGGKLCLFGQKRFPSQRSGWGYAMDALRPLHNSRGHLFDGFLENNFSWRYPHEGHRPAQEMEHLRKFGWYERDATSEELGLVPYQRPWLGVFHNPPDMPPGFHDHARPQAILERRIWRDSLPHCRGLYALSESLAHWLHAETGLPVEVLRHPTETPRRLFDWERFRANPQPRIVQVGWWLRRLTSIFRLPVRHHYRKLWLITLPFLHARSHFLQLMEREGGKPDCPNTDEVEQLSNDDYDALLSENLVFLDLYDSSANCAVIECIARATPVLVNPLAAVREYLGEDYPLYYSSLSEAAEMALDFDRLLQAHQYLQALPLREQLSGHTFCERLRQGKLYQELT